MEMFHYFIKARSSTRIGLTIRDKVFTVRIHEVMYNGINPIMNGDNSDARFCF